MADLESPAQDTTTTDTTTSNTRTKTYVGFDSSYARSKGGILKIIQCFQSFLGFISIQCTAFALHVTGKWFSTVSLFGFLITSFLLFCYLFHFVEKFSKISWIKFELFYCAILALCFLVASSMAASIEDSACIAAAFFGFCAMAVYGADAFLKYFAFKSGEPAQGRRKISKDTATDNNTPA